MRQIYIRLRNTFAAGLFVLVPTAVVMLVILKVYASLHPAFSAVAHYFGVQDVLGIRIFVIAVLVLACLIVGAFMRSTGTGRFRQGIEDLALRTIPGYSYFRVRLRMAMGQDEMAGSRAILFKTGDGWVPAVLVERNADGRHVVFVPETPDGRNGSVFLAEEDQVRLLGIAYGKLETCMHLYGRGLIDLHDGMPGRKT
jgi:uncharacterized membrane protein